VRNSSLVKRVRAENVTGLKYVTEATDFMRKHVVVGEHSRGREGRAASTAGAPGREYAGISNDKTGEKPVRRKSKVSWARLIPPG
jgi:hypothetical protein